MSDRRNSDLRLWMFLIMPCCGISFAVFQHRIIFPLLAALASTCFEVGRLRGPSFANTAARYTACIVGASFGSVIGFQVLTSLSGLNDGVFYDVFIDLSNSTLLATILALCLGRQVRGLKQFVCVVTYVSIVQPTLEVVFFGGYDATFPVTAVAAALGVLLTEPRNPDLQRTLEANQSNWLYILGTVGLTFSLASWGIWAEHYPDIGCYISVFASGVLSLAFGVTATKKPLPQFLAIGLMSASIAISQLEVSLYVIPIGIISLAAVVAANTVGVRDELNTIVAFGVGGLWYFVWTLPFEIDSLLFGIVIITIPMVSMAFAGAIINRLLPKPAINRPNLKSIVDSDDSI